jgi:hygromycin-B 7''-O-kinase
MTHDPDPRDPVLDADRVLELTRRHLPSARSVTDVDETGGEARTYVIDEAFVFKTQRPHRVRPRTSLEKEVFHLNQLASRAPGLSVPRVLGYGRESDVEYILMTRMPGVAMRRLTLSGPARARVLGELGGLLRVMHGLDPAPFRESGLFPGDEDTTATRSRLEADLQRAAETAAEQGDGWNFPFTPQEAADRVRDGLQRIEDSPVPLHSNPGPEHVFVDPNTLRLTGVIDFGDAYLSHPALDLRRWARPVDRIALMEGYTADTQVSECFQANWRAISVAMLMLDYALRPSRRAESLEGLRVLVSGD